MAASLVRKTKWMIDGHRNLSNSSIPLIQYQLIWQPRQWRTVRLELTSRLYRRLTQLCPDGLTWVPVEKTIPFLMVSDNLWWDLVVEATLDECKCRLGSDHPTLWSIRLLHYNKQVKVNKAIPGSTTGKFSLATWCGFSRKSCCIVYLLLTSEHQEIDAAINGVKAKVPEIHGIPVELLKDNIRLMYHRKKKAIYILITYLKTLK